jgi:hypothetical protein
MRPALATALLLSIACRTPADAADEQPMKNETAKASSWIVNLDTTGGMTGHGLGRVRITSDGDVVAGIQAEELTGTLRPEEREALETAIAAADVTKWGSATHTRGGDQITYTLQLERGDVRGEAVWMDGTSTTADAMQIKELAWRVHQRIWDEARQ